MTSNFHFPSFGLQRRQLLGGAMAAGVAAQLAPWSWAATPAADTSRFMDLSHYLTERNDLNARLGARMQAALQALNPQFSAQVDALWQWVESQQVPLAQLNERLKAEKPELAGIPAAVMQVWYLGIAGSGIHTRVVAYEFALNAQTVADKLKPPTYAYGVYGSWTRNPTTFNLQRLPVHS
ncbi:hypothetical protein CBP36_00065 [Acidovorax carolinensis]|uniref:Sorbitol dehydrogenase n=1 Tax=Acidovorax carolinensis TaxID=553814 RepID=A0A240U7H1_9BURK|nr:sugar dehydrogenase complex small subunit [Acidovorax carolinensis]ART56561.1 hypothetical protein CBP35_18885 [Acidovorax carolinensis]ART57471.1 hypothetical protein CBP36_00065 [Acidovorax carolinensis]